MSPGERLLALGKFKQGQLKTSLPSVGFQGNQTDQMMTPAQQWGFLRAPAVFFSLQNQLSRLLLFRATSELEGGESNQSKLRFSWAHCSLLRFSSFFWTTCSLNYCEILVDFQSSKNADSDKFCSLFHRFPRRTKLTVAFLLMLLLPPIFLMLKLSLIWPVEAFQTGFCVLLTSAYPFFCQSVFLPVGLQPQDFPWVKSETSPHTYRAGRKKKATPDR